MATTTPMTTPSTPSTPSQPPFHIQLLTCSACLVACLGTLFSGLSPVVEQVAIACALTLAHHLPRIPRRVKALCVASSLARAVLNYTRGHSWQNPRDTTGDLLCVVPTLLGFDAVGCREACERVRWLPWLVACVVYAQVYEAGAGCLSIYVASWLFNVGFLDGKYALASVGVSCAWKVVRRVYAS